MKQIGLLMVFVVLASCGANGAPLRPTGGANVSVGTNGVSVGSNVGLSNGTVSVNVGRSISSN